MGKGYLGSFALEYGLYGFSVEAFTEWQRVMYGKDRRHRTAHPLKTRTEGLTFLRGLTDTNDSCIRPHKNAAFALVVAAEKLGL
ncbi:hypothetical protein HYH02_003994 [Chlamydomonas schloesseri]|uniref:Uncharacterized protein n=1 Tax=Chlamydomonas schloesseri TaxID=2026947 RepID=A0A835WP22_9CHLO|nr:hypothetical protein HYH02_003994 [Chlamydomonas schloesseri]|eukprot:KAG2451393.1 hypothetical protein HYH02_003994 [Chlamydomonas schloesseri]